MFKSVYIHTMGCQMNVYDSLAFESQLASLNYKKINDLNSANLIILNTCTVREKAEQKAFSFLGSIKHLKKENTFIVVTGCLAQQEGKNIFQRMPFIDLVLGTDCVFLLKDYVKRLENGERHLTNTSIFNKINEIDCKNKVGISNFVTIMKGCNNFCSYCIVPYVRGREKSRKKEAIINEIKNIVDNGGLEITLLGQNVNSYGLNTNIKFHSLLEEINEIKGLKRIRFATSHPKDISDELILCFSRLNKIAKHIHLPVQSGSNKILNKMNRHYSRENYFEIITKLRKACPDISITTDILLGFPDELQEDFQNTLDLVKKVEFDSIFSFIYSDRKNTKACEFQNKISLKEKKERIYKLLEIQKKISLKKNLELLNKDFLIIIERLKENGQYTGRTTHNKIINFNYNGSENLIGKMKTIKVKKIMQNSLFGKIIP